MVRKKKRELEMFVPVMCRHCRFIFHVRDWIFKNISQDEIYCPRCGQRGVVRIIIEKKEEEEEKV